MDLRGPAEARLLHVERALEQMARDLRNDQRALIAIGQGIWAEWGAVGGIAAGPSTVTVSFSGNTYGCFTTADPGVTVEVQDAATSAIYASVTSGAGGAFSGTFTCPSGSMVNFVSSGSEYTTLTDGPYAATGSITGLSESLSPTSSYVCAYGCATPIPTTVTLTDSVYGACTLTWNGSTGWVGCQTGPYPGHGVCPSGTTAITYILGNITLTPPRLQLTWPNHVVSLTSCPLVGATCATTTTNSDVITASSFSCAGSIGWTLAPSVVSPWPSGATFSASW